MKQTAVHILLLLIVAGGIFFTNLGKSRLWDRDEPRNAGCAVEMMSRGDLVVPTFNDELRPQKPVLLYWLMMSAYWLFGINEFSARFWSAVLSIGTVMMTYVISCRLKNPTVGFMAGLILSTSLMFDVSARAATPDSLLIFFTTLSIMLYVLGTFAPREHYEDEEQAAVDSREGEDEDGEAYINEPVIVPPEWKDEEHLFPQNWLFACGMYVAMGFGVLAKGPIGFLMPMSVIGMFMLVQGLPSLSKSYWKSHGWLSRLVINCVRPFNPVHFLTTCWRMRPFTALFVIGLVSAPWFIAVTVMTEGDFAKQFFVGEHWGRATTAFENHTGGLWFYPVAILLGFFPWSVFVVPTVVDIDRQVAVKCDWTVSTVLMLCWVGVWVGLFSLFATKLPSYITPCYPALAILTAACLYRWVIDVTGVHSFWFYASLVSLVVGGIAITCGLGYVSWKLLPGSWWLLGLGLVPLLGGAICLLLLNLEMKRFVPVSMAVTAVLFCFVFFGFGTKYVSQFQSNFVLLDEIRDTQPDVYVASYRCMESSWVIYGQKTIYELDPNPNPGLIDPTVLEREKWWQPKPRVSPETFVASYPTAVFLTTEEHVDELRSRLPHDYRVIDKTDYFLQGEKLVLMVRQNSEIALRRANRETIVR